MNYKLYLDYIDFKSEIIKTLVYAIYNEYKKQFSTGDIIIVGSLLHTKLNIQNKKYINDIDISINNNMIGNEIIENINNFLNQLDLSDYINYYNRNFELYLKDMKFNDLLAIDFFRNDHLINCDINIEIYPNVYTKFFGYEWNLNYIYKSYQNLLSLPENNKHKIKQINKYEILFYDYLKFINENEFQNIELYNNIIKVLNK